MHFNKYHILGWGTILISLTIIFTCLAVMITNTLDIYNLFTGNWSWRSKWLILQEGEIFTNYREKSRPVMFNWFPSFIRYGLSFTMLVLTTLFGFATVDDCFKMAEKHPKRNQLSRLFLISGLLVVTSFCIFVFYPREKKVLIKKQVSAGDVLKDFATDLWKNSASP